MLGLPVLASDVAPLPDYVIEGETGFRVGEHARGLGRAAALDRRRTRRCCPPVSDRARAFVEARYAVARNLGALREPASPRWSADGLAPNGADSGESSNAETVWNPYGS